MDKKIADEDKLHQAATKSSFTRFFTSTLNKGDLKKVITAELDADHSKITEKFEEARSKNILRDNNKKPLR